VGQWTTFSHPLIRPWWGLLILQMAAWSELSVCAAVEIALTLAWMVSHRPAAGDKWVYSAVVMPLTKELPTKVQFLQLHWGCPHLSRWEKNFPPEFPLKKELSSRPQAVQHVTDGIVWTRCPGNWLYIMLELLDLAHREFQIIPNKSQRHIHAWWVATF
jgi:hypothetical protein